MKMKIRENRLRILRQMEAGKWYVPSDLEGAELFLLERMKEAGLLECKYDQSAGTLGLRYKKLEGVAV